MIETIVARGPQRPSGQVKSRSDAVRDLQVNEHSPKCAQTTVEVHNAIVGVLIERKESSGVCNFFRSCKAADWDLFYEFFLCTGRHTCNMYISFKGQVENVFDGNSSEGARGH